MDITDKGSIRLIFTDIFSRIVISLRVSNGRNGWLWYLEDEWKHAVVVGFHIIRSDYTAGFQVFLGPFNFLMGWFSPRD
jgi:hypothetical protein